MKISIGCSLRSMFAARGSLHAHTFTLFECSLSNDPLSAKKHECVSGIRPLIAGTFRCGHCESLVTISPIGLREKRVRIKLQIDFFVIVTLEGCKPDRVH